MARPVAAQAMLAALTLLALCSCVAGAFVEPQEIAVVQGVAFAVLDGSPPDAEALGCQGSFLEAPPLSSLWAIANPNNPTHRMAVAAHRWGTSCLVMEGGVALAHDLSSCSSSDALLRQAVPSPTPSSTPTPSATPSNTPSSTPTPSATPSNTPSSTPTPSATPPSPSSDSSDSPDSSKPDDSPGERVLDSSLLFQKIKVNSGIPQVSFTAKSKPATDVEASALPSLLSFSSRSVSDLGDVGVDELWAPAACDQRILLYRRGPPPSPFAAGDFTNTDACQAAWTSDDDSDAVVGCQNGQLIASVPAGKSLSLSQTIAAPADGHLQQGFFMAVQVALESSKKMELRVNLLLQYADDSDEQSTQVDLTTPSFTTEVRLPEILPEKTIVNVTVTFSVHPSKDTQITLSNLRFEPIDSLLANHELSSEDFLLVEEWRDFGKGYMPDLADRSGAGDSLFNSILLLSARMDEFTAESQGARQEINSELWGSSSLCRALYLGGFSKAAYASDLMDDGYGLRIDVDFADGGLYGTTVQFPVGSHDWTYADAVLHLPAPAVTLRVTLVFGPHTGAVWFDDIYLRVLSSSEASHPMATAAAFGDPRFVTFHSHSVYGLQEPGEYILFEHDDLTVHTRHSALEGSGSSLITAVGIEIGDSRAQVQFEDSDDDEESSRVEDPRVSLNCVTVDSGGVLLPHIGALSRSNGVALNMRYDHITHEASEEEQIQLWTYILSFSGGEIDIGVRFLLNEDNEKAAGYLQVVLRLEEGLYSDVGGLLGSTTTGKLHSGSESSSIDASNATQAELNAIGKYWAVKSEAESLLCYSGGNGPSSYATHSEEELYSTRQELEDFPEQEAFTANLTCQREKLGALQESCMLDVLVTENLSAIQAYHELEVALGIAQPMLLIVNATQVHDFTPEETEGESYRFSLIIVITMVIIFAFGGVVTVFRCKKKRPPVRNAALADDEDTIELQELMISEEDQIDRFET